MKRLARHRRTLASVALAGSLALLGVGILSILISGILFPFPNAISSKNSLPITPAGPPSAVALENRQPGTTKWEIDPNADTTYIQGYANKDSALPGENVLLYVSSVAPVAYRLDVYRMGWYQGLGGRLVFSQSGLQSLAQGTWTKDRGLAGCGTCTFDPQTYLVETHWRSPVSLTVGTHWLTGIYLIKLTATNRAENYIILVVRDDKTPTAILANLAVNTYQAYNIWGGYSLYGTEEDVGGNHFIGGQRGYEVSFDRPYDRSAGAGDFLGWDIQTIRWLEHQGLDVAYTTDEQVSADPALVLRHRIFMALGHDEYWTLAMRNGIEAARNAGVSLAFMGADDSYWQNRYLPDSAGQADRTVVCYKVSGYSNSTPSTAPKLDPLYATHPDEVTAQWRDSLLKRPESTLLGILYHGIIQTNSHPDWVVASPPDPLGASVGLQAGQHITGGLLGYEYDGLANSNFTPAGLTIIAQSPLVNQEGKQDVALTAYYRAPSGALVFDAGSIWWSWGLDAFNPPAAYQANVLKGNTQIEQLMQAIIAQMLKDTPVAPALQTPTAIPQASATGSGLFFGTRLARGAEIQQGAFGAKRRGGLAYGAAMIDHHVRKIEPIFLVEQCHQVTLNLGRVFFGRQT
jgi:hypothetical protein